MAAKVRTTLSILSLWTLIWVGFHLFDGSQVTSQQSPSVCRYNVTDSRCKKILLWNNADRIEMASFGRGHQAFVRQQCPVQDCFLAAHPSPIPLQLFDAVVIFVQQVKELPPAGQRSPNQRFVFFSQEPPVMLPIEPTRYDHYFNWTMTYRRNSDIRFLYGRVHPLTQLSEEEIPSKIKAPASVNYAENKTRLVAWMVSHCQTYSQREVYVQRLRRYIDVDVYGKCGSFRCRRSAKHWLSYPHCYDLIEQRYKFYLSFENSICNDYVTEKFFHILEHNVVPVVFGGADYSSIAPLHSYIDALQYTPAQLADYLRLLDNNDTLYNQFFWWKPYYKVEAGVGLTARNGFCDLCAKLHQDDTRRVHDSLVLEWSNETQCRKLPDTLGL
jgi:alpha-1,3-fucosyltransferase